MTVELLKLLVQPVVLERDDDGRVVGEKLGEPTALYSESQISEFYVAVQTEIARANANGNGGP